MLLRFLYKDYYRDACEKEEEEDLRLQRYIIPPMSQSEDIHDKKPILSVQFKKMMMEVGSVKTISSVELYPFEKECATEEVFNPIIPKDSKSRVDLFQKELIFQCVYPDGSFSLPCPEKIAISLLLSTQYLRISVNPMNLVSDDRDYSYDLSVWNSSPRQISPQLFEEIPTSQNTRDDPLITLPVPSLHPFNLFSYSIPSDIPMQHLPLYLSDESISPTYSLHFTTPPSPTSWNPVPVPYLRFHEETFPLLFLQSHSHSPPSIQSHIPPSLPLSGDIPNHLMDRSSEMDLFQYAGSLNTRFLLPISLTKLTSSPPNVLNHKLSHTLESTRIISLLSKTIQLGLIFGSRFLNQIKADLSSDLDCLPMMMQWNRSDVLSVIQELSSRSDDSSYHSQSQEPLNQVPIAPSTQTPQVTSINETVLHSPQPDLNPSTISSVPQSTPSVCSIPPHPSSPTPQSNRFDSILEEIASFASHSLSYLQQESLLPSSSTLSSLTTTTIATLVDYIQSQLSLIIHSTPITQATSLLTPLRGALQASVTLHALITLREGLEQDEVDSMQCYLNLLLHNEDYQRILPEDSFSFLQHIDSLLSTDSSSQIPLNLSPSPLKESSPLSNPSPIQEETPIQSNSTSHTILLEESLLSSFPSFVRSFTQSNLDYYCRSLHGPHLIIDINTAVFCLTHHIILNPSSLKEFITTVSLMYPRYSTIHILVLLQTTSTPEIASNILALQAGLILIPLRITLHYAYSQLKALIHRSSEDTMIEILERLYEQSPLREGVWGDSYDDRSFLTENETPLQKWYECIPSVNPFAACFLASTIHPEDLVRLQSPNPWLRDEVLKGIFDLMNKQFGACGYKERVDKREGLIQVNRVPKRVKLFIDKENAVNGQTKIGWKEEDKKSAYFDKNDAILSSLDGFDTQVY